MNTSAKLIAGIALVSLLGFGCTDDPADDSANLQISCGDEALFTEEHDACEAMDAQGVNGGQEVACPCILGFMWDGAACVQIDGCVCEGADCGKLTQSVEACMALHSACDGEGDDDTDPCAAMDVTVVDPPAGQPPCGCVIGYAWDGASCQPLENGVCSGSDCDELTVTLEECVAAHATCNAEGADLQLSCGDPRLYDETHQACAPMDAAGDGGTCACLVGFAWNGTSCEGITGCSCVGSDCDKLTEMPEACEAAHASCA